MKKPVISYVLISLSVSILGLNACGPMPGSSVELKPGAANDLKVQPANQNNTEEPGQSGIKVNKTGNASSGGVKMVSEAEFNRLRADSNFIVQDEEVLATAAQEAKISLAEDKTVIDQFLKLNPDHFSFVYDRPSTDDSAIRFLDDGNYELKIKNSLGAEQSVITLGQDWKLRTFAAALRNFPARENQLEIYNKLYESMNDEFKTASSASYSLKATELTREAAATEPSFSRIAAEEEKVVLQPARQTFPKPDDVSRMKTDDILKLNYYIVNDWKKLIKVNIFSDKPIGYVSNPANEIGAGNGNDRTGTSASCSTHKAGGIYNNYHWSNKYYVTSVKNQGNRGTCVAFGITSADEMKIARLNNRWVNLSEQDYYYKNKAVWWPSTYGDGLNTTATWQKLDILNYRMPYENDWNYNPSYSRIANAAAQTYTNSCNGYGEECSNTNHQGQQICINTPAGNVCGSYSGANTSNPYTLPGNIQELWNPANKGLSVALTAINLALGNPVVISLNVTPSFDNPDANGFVHYGGAAETSRGGHALHVTGFIENDELDERLPGAPAGAGGGYFIVKNSWGVCFADAGYIYLPFDWVKRNTYSMLVRN